MAFADAAGAVLKVNSKAEISRIPLPGKPDLKTVLEKIATVWHGTKLPLIKYQDEEGDLCTLVEATFTDFLSTARPPFNSEVAGRPVLKVTLLEADASGCQEEPLPKMESAKDQPMQSAKEEVLESSSDDTLGNTVAEDLGDEKSAFEDATDSSGDSEYELVSFDEAVLEVDLEVNERSLEPETEPSKLSETEDAVVKRRKVSTDDDEMLLVSEALMEAPTRFGNKVDDDEEEALAMVEKARKACEDELANHLRSWLASNPDKAPRYEAWINDVHPENASKSGSNTVDSRMYLEASFHRLLWNEMAVTSAELEPEERARRFVPSTEDLQAMQRVCRDDQAEQPWDTSAVLNPSAPAPSFQPPAFGTLTATCQEAADAGPSQLEPFAPPYVAPPFQEAVLYLTGFLERRSSEAVPQAEQPTEQMVAETVQISATADQHTSGPVVWKEEAVNFLATSFRGAARQLQRRTPRTPLGLGLPEDCRPGLSLLAEVLRESGPEYETLASAAIALASGSTLNGDGVAELLGRAATQNWEVRVVYARALLACCPEVLVPVLPAHLREIERRAATEARNVARGAFRQSAREQAALVRQQTVAAAREAAAAKVAQARCRAAETRAKALRHAAQAHRAALVAACRR